MAVVVAIDAGTSSVRALAIDESCRVVASSYRELPQYFPAPGLVEHDPAQIWDLVETTLSELATTIIERSLKVAAIGIANQRETAVAWIARLVYQLIAPLSGKTGALRTTVQHWPATAFCPWCASVRVLFSTPISRAPSGPGCSPTVASNKEARLLSGRSTTGSVGT